MTSASTALAPGPTRRRCQHEDLTRRLCNQALSTRVCIEDDLSLRPEHTQPFEPLLDADFVIQASSSLSCCCASGV